MQIKLSFWWFEGPPTRNRGPEGPKTSSCWIFYVESAKCNAKCQNKTDFFSANILGKLPAISLKDNLRRWRTFSNCNFWTPQKVKWNICVSTLSYILICISFKYAFSDLFQIGSKFGHLMHDISSKVPKLATRLSHIATLPWNAFLSLSVSIQFVSSSVRVTSLNFHKRHSVTHLVSDRELDP